MNSDQVRQAFLDYFSQQNHQVVKASSVVPQNDPTLLFTNAGMNQFKDVFLGTGTRPYTRAVDSQVCIRVSGKHNDLEDVGRDGTHLTSFEMLGNWSFADYYKKEAIIWAWQFLTQTLKFPASKLYATVFEDDEEAEQLWRSQTSINPDHIVRCGKKDNFWEMGETGPCGPCSEIHLDLAPDHANQDIERDPETGGLSERYVELWNLVFIQYDRQANGELKPLPGTHVDTGAGLERIVAQLQGVNSVYETDIFKPIISKIESLTGQPYEPGEAGMPHRVIADHIRTLCFTIADNVLPSNEGRGYVLRRLLRRAMRFAKKIGQTEPLIFKLVDTVVDGLGHHFTHLTERRDMIKTLIEAEEKAFLKTLDSGVSIFEEMVKKGGSISGEACFKLYDTYGFPIDLTALMAEERGVSCDLDGFQIELEKQQRQSREARKARQSDTDVQTGEKEYAPVHPTIFNEPKGGEARLVFSKDDQVGMARLHTATHLLHEGLRQVLGDHVQQAGSLVDIDRLHFDFSHFSQVSKDELRQVEEKVNAYITQNISVQVSQHSLEEAKAMGATALFGETYDDDDVRVVQIGPDSIELCGGNHVLETGLLEDFYIVHETSVATGIRRIEALVGRERIDAYLDKKRSGRIKEISARYQRLKVDHDALLALDSDSAALQPLRDCNELSLSDLDDYEEELIRLSKQTEKQLGIAKERVAGQDLRSIIEKKVDYGTHSALVVRQDGYDLKMLRSLSDNIVNLDPKIICVLASETDGAGLCLVRVPKELNSVHARDIFNVVTDIAGGRGGGPNHMAQGGGLDPSKIDAALKQVDTYFHSLQLA